MAYEKQNWNTGETITADKLNHMEDGIASGGVMVVQTTGELVEGAYHITMQNTWQEIYDALISGKNVFVNIPLGETDQYFIITAYFEYGFWVGGSTMIFGTNTSSGYATFETTPPEG